MNGRFEMGDIAPSTYFFTIAVACGLAFAAIADAPNGVVPGLINIVQWQLQTVVPMLLLVLSHTVLQKIIGFKQFNPMVALCCSAISGCVIFTPIALVIENVLGQVKGPFQLSTLLKEFAAITPPITIVWIAVNAPWVLGYRVNRPNKIVTTDESINPNPRLTDLQLGDEAENIPKFLSLLPAESIGDIIYLEAELHYLSVITENGGGLILYNLRDAIKELTSQSGVQIHRSFWVAFKYVDDIKSEGRQGRIILKSGKSLPISRQRLKEVRAEFTTYKESR